MSSQDFELESRTNAELNLSNSAPVSQSQISEATNSTTKHDVGASVNTSSTGDSFPSESTDIAPANASSLHTLLFPQTYASWTSLVTVPSSNIQKAQVNQSGSPVSHPSPVMTSSSKPSAVISTPASPSSTISSLLGSIDSEHVIETNPPGQPSTTTNLVTGNQNSPAPSSYQPKLPLKSNMAQTSKSTSSVPTTATATSPPTIRHGGSVGHHTNNSTSVRSNNENTTTSDLNSRLQSIIPEQVSFLNIDLLTSIKLPNVELSLMNHTTQVAPTKDEGLNEKLSNISQFTIPNTNTSTEHSTLSQAVSNASIPNPFLFSTSVKDTNTIKDGIEVGINTSHNAIDDVQKQRTTSFSSWIMQKSTGREFMFSLDDVVNHQLFKIPKFPTSAENAHTLVSESGGTDEIDLIVKGLAASHLNDLRSQHNDLVPKEGSLQASASVPPAESSASRLTSISTTQLTQASSSSNKISNAEIPLFTSTVSGRVITESGRDILKNSTTISRAMADDSGPTGWLQRDNSSTFTLPVQNRRSSKTNNNSKELKSNTEYTSTIELGSMADNSVSNGHQNQLDITNRTKKKGNQTQRKYNASDRYSQPKPIKENSRFKNYLTYGQLSEMLHSDGNEEQLFVCNSYLADLTGDSRLKLENQLLAIFNSNDVKDATKFIMELPTPKYSETIDRMRIMNPNFLTNIQIEEAIERTVLPELSAHIQKLEELRDLYTSLSHITSAIEIPDSELPQPIIEKAGQMSTLSWYRLIACKLILEARSVKRSMIYFPNPLSSDEIKSLASHLNIREPSEDISPVKLQIVIEELLLSKLFTVDEYSEFSVQKLSKAQFGIIVGIVTNLRTANGRDHFEKYFLRPDDEVLEWNPFPCDHYNYERHTVIIKLGLSKIPSTKLMQELWYQKRATQQAELNPWEAWRDLCRVDESAAKLSSKIDDVIKNAELLNNALNVLATRQLRAGYNYVNDNTQMHFQLRFALQHCHLCKTISHSSNDCFKLGCDICGSKSHSKVRCSQREQSGEERTLNKKDKFIFDAYLEGLYGTVFSDYELALLQTFKNKIIPSPVKFIMELDPPGYTHRLIIHNPSRLSDDEITEGLQCYYEPRLETYKSFLKDYSDKLYALTSQINLEHSLCGRNQIDLNQLNSISLLLSSWEETLESHRQMLCKLIALKFILAGHTVNKSRFYILNLMSIQHIEIELALFPAAPTPFKSVLPSEIRQVIEKELHKKTFEAADKKRRTFTFYKPTRAKFGYAFGEVTYNKGIDGRNYFVNNILKSQHTLMDWKLRKSKDKGKDSSIVMLKLGQPNAPSNTQVLANNEVQMTFTLKLCHNGDLVDKKVNY